MSTPKSVVCLADGTPVPVMEDPATIAANLGLHPLVTETGATIYINRDHIVFLGANLVEEDTVAPAKLELL